MLKIEAIGNGFIRVNDTLVNLIQYKEIEKYTFGYDEDPENGSRYGITLTPSAPDIESYNNGVDGSYFITTYQEDEFDDFEADFDTIISVLQS